LELASLSGPLTVTRQGELLTLDFPATAVEAVEAPRNVRAALGVSPVEVHAADDWMIVLDDGALAATVRDP